MDSHSQHKHENKIDKPNHEAHDQHQKENHDGKHKGHGVDHSGHENMFRRRFWVSLLKLDDFDEELATEFIRRKRYNAPEPNAP